MKFKEYRRKETIRAAEITEERLLLKPAGDPQPSTVQVEAFSKGDFVESAAGELYGWKKEDFEREFQAVRAPRQSSGQKRKPRTKVATNADPK
jgi:hypothetical protein